MNRDILVTGSNGFMGRSFVNRLKSADEYNVFEVSREKSFWKGQPYGKIDLNSLESVYDLFRKFAFSEVFHFAGNSSVLDSWNNPLESLNYNARMTSNLVNAINAYQPETKLILISSSAVYARSPLPISETSMLGPDSPYGMAKLISEYEVKKVKNSLILRPFFVIGKGKKNDVLHDWISQIVSFQNSPKRLLEVGNVDVIRDFISIDSATEIVMTLGMTENGVFNLGSGQPTSLRDVLEVLGNVSNCKFEINENVASKTRKSDRLMVVADISKLNGTLNIPKSQSLTEQISSIYESIATPQPFNRYS
jgi:GDP-4-dehydro-6-deoxy-D-mannose reductase